VFERKHERNYISASTSLKNSLLMLDCECCQCACVNRLIQGWAINLAWGPFEERRI